MSTSTDAVAEEVRSILAEHARLSVDVATLGDDDDLYAAGMTSHASVTVMLACEDAYDLEFPQAQLKKSTFATVGSITTALTGLGAGA
jgi:acyl carrier protein